ncbi:winged helix-turn-helix domain-containing protein [Micromonospora sp. ATA32]|nr:winged helix-turn-helix domain-containing protein [Micromonospora sp. ATA32]
MRAAAGETIGFSVLGSIKVVRAGAELHLGARQQRLVLALLLARAGSPVSLAELVDLLWDEEAPASAANVVHRHVGVLRRLLEPGLPTRSAGRHILRELSGYRLRADEESLDLLKFRSLSRLAGRSLQDGDPESALRHSLDGLRLWRGRCAAGLEPASRLHPAFLAVEAERAQAVREAADAAERCGRLSAVLAPLRQAAEQHPLDESLQSRLLLALAADGRQAEAVEMYRVVRRRLADDLGIDPGEELREAYDRLLHQRTQPARTESPSPLPRPAQLPPDLPFFSGRDDVIAEARAAVARPGGPAVLAIDGMPGIGKTALAVHLAHEFAAGYPDGQLYVDLRGYDGREPAMSPAEALRGFLGSLGVPQEGIPAELHAQAGMYRSSLAGRRLLIVLDNCRDAEQIRHLLPGSPGCLVIVTSRSRLSTLLTTAGAHPLPVGLPSVDEARAVLLGPLGAGRVAADPAAIDAIIASCGRLPLALAVVAARAASLPRTPPARIAAELAQAPGSLDGFDDDDPQTGLRAVFSWSYQALSAPAARLFRLLPIHPGPDISIAGAAGLAGVPLRSGRALIGELSRAHLISEDLPGRYRTPRPAAGLCHGARRGDRQPGRARRRGAALPAVLPGHLLSGAPAAAGLRVPPDDRAGAGRDPAALRRPRRRHALVHRRAAGPDRAGRQGRPAGPAHRRLAARPGHAALLRPQRPVGRLDDDRRGGPRGRPGGRRPGRAGPDAPQPGRGGLLPARARDRGRASRPGARAARPTRPA